MRLLTDILKSKQLTFSLEVFPPKTEKGYLRLQETLGEMARLNPDFISCTYGAGGGNRERTLDIAAYIQTAHNIPAMAHLTCVGHSRTQIRAILDEIRSRNISNILALRGDLPAEGWDGAATRDGFRYSSELVAFIREYCGRDCSIGVAGFPEGHVEAKSREADALVLKEKVLAGADFVITQLFFNNSDYFDYVHRLRELGINKPIVPGILLIRDYQGMIRFCKQCGTAVSDEVHALFKPIADDPGKILKTGVEFAVRQCLDLIKNGAPGIHFYTLNKADQVAEVIKNLSAAPPSS